MTPALCSSHKDWLAPYPKWNEIQCCSGTIWPSPFSRYWVLFEFQPFPRHFLALFSAGWQIFTRHGNPPQLRCCHRTEREPLPSHLFLILLQMRVLRRSLGCCKPPAIAFFTWNSHWILVTWLAQTYGALPAGWSCSPVGDKNSVFPVSEAFSPNCCRASCIF